MDVNFDNLFARMDSESSIAILLFLLGSFLFGLLVNALLSGATKRRLRQTIKEQEDLLQNKELELVTLRETAKKHQSDLEIERRKAVDLDAERRRATDLQDQVNRLELDKKKIYSEVYALNQQIEDLTGHNNHYATEAAELQAQIALLNARPAPQPVVAAELQPATSSPTNEYDLTSPSMEARLELVEDRLSALAAENQRLRTKIESLHEQPRPIDADQPLAVNLSSSERELTIDPDKSVINQRILVEDRKRDPLANITGVGPFLEQKLNEIGIYTYADLAALDRSRYDEVENRIGWLPGRIEQDDWVGQATRLMRMPKGEPRSFDQVSGRIVVDDDLQRIEGIGPQIEQILKDGGIRDWETLASIDPTDLSELLVSVDDRFRMHSPETWPAQARMAANGQWDELAAYQDELRGGRKVTE